MLISKATQKHRGDLHSFSNQLSSSHLNDTSPMLLLVLLLSCSREFPVGPAATGTGRDWIREVLKLRRHASVISTTSEIRWDSEGTKIAIQATSLPLCLETATTPPGTLRVEVLPASRPLRLIDRLLMILEFSMLSFLNPTYPSHFHQSHPSSALPPCPLLPLVPFLYWEGTSVNRPTDRRTNHKAYCLASLTFGTLSPPAWVRQLLDLHGIPLSVYTQSFQPPVCLL